MPRAGINQATVVAAAAEMADADGLESVTFARLAARFGVRPPSLYNHVAGTEGLRRELALLGLRELIADLTRVAIGRAGAEAVLALSNAYRAFAQRRPGLYAAAVVRPPAAGDLEWEQLSATMLDIVVAVLAAYDLRGDDAIHAVRGLRSLLHGFVTLETSGGFGIPLDLNESFRRLVATYVAGLE
jgi:AcrR family transcriptional regulator